MDFEQPALEFAFEIRADCGPPHMVGQTPDGMASMIPILGGSVEGAQIKGRVRPGGADWPLRRSDQSMVIDARYEIETDDGVIIRIHNRGMATIAGEGARVRTHASFIAPAGVYDWLNKSMFVSTVNINPADMSVVFVRFYKLI